MDEKYPEVTASHIIDIVLDGFKEGETSFGVKVRIIHWNYNSVILLCLSGQEMGPTGQRPFLGDSWRQNSILWEGQLADPTIAFITWMNEKVNNKARNIEKFLWFWKIPQAGPSGPILESLSFLWPRGHGGHPDIRKVIIFKIFGINQYDSQKLKNKKNKNIQCGMCSLCCLCYLSQNFN